jgi:catechol 2,3-dioxygenase-like lactoylglutathione lyase family enzyme
MIQRFSHISIYVIDQNAAYDFYVNKLGFDVHTDATMDGGFRWLTVCPKGQPDLEIALMPCDPGPMMDQETSDMLRTLVSKGAIGSGVLETADIQKTYEELKSKGVEFSSPPTERFYGIEALFKDNSGNWFSLSERKEPQAQAAGRK